MRDGYEMKRRGDEKERGALEEHGEPMRWPGSMPRLLEVTEARDCYAG
jgi:hypothetical protein